MGLFDFFKRKKEETTQPIGEETGLTFGQEDEKAKEETQREERAEQEPASFAEEEKEEPSALETEENLDEATMLEEAEAVLEEKIADGTLDVEDAGKRAELMAEALETVEESEEEVTEASDVEETAEEAAVIEEALDLVGEEEEEERAVISAPPVEEAAPKKSFFARLKEGLGKTRNSILGGVDAVLGAFTKIDEDLFEELEEILIMADLGVETTEAVMEGLRKRVKRQNVTDPAAVKGLLMEEISALLTEGAEETFSLSTPAVMLVIGVNGVGKTTTIGKLASSWKAEGNSVLLAAADTFRAAAIDQLEVWGKRAGIDVIKHEENSDPAAVVFDAVHAAQNRKADILICDTAGRLHNKRNLMEELKKISKVIDREYPAAHRETFLVLDATTGQNALQQARLFQEVADITGIILTKLDGTAKGGIVVAIKNELKIPVRYIGVGEGIADLQPFDASAFAKALFGEEM